MSFRKVTVLFAAILSMITFAALAQRVPAPGAAGPGVRGQAGFGFQGKHAQDQLAALKGEIEVSEGEWKTLSPKIEKVLIAKQNMSTGAGMNWSSSNNAKPVFEASKSKPDTAAGRAMQAVRDAVADAETPEAELTKRMTAVRNARLKARAEYEAAMIELMDAIKPRQQAILMTFGVVE